VQACAARQPHRPRHRAWGRLPRPIRLPPVPRSCRPAGPSTLTDITRESELIGPAGNEPRAGAAAPGGGWAHAAL